MRPLRPFNYALAVTLAVGGLFLSSRNTEAQTGRGVSMAQARDNVAAGLPPDAIPTGANFQATPSGRLLADGNGNLVPQNGQQIPVIMVPAPVAPPWITAKGIIDILQPVLDSAAGKSGLLPALITLIGLFRLGFKPITHCIEAAAHKRGGTAEIAVNRFEGSPGFKVASFLCDYLGSIKIAALAGPPGTPSGGTGPAGAGTIAPAAAAAAVCALLVGGCARFSTMQVEEQYGPNGARVKLTTTHASSVTVFDSKSNLSHFHALQSDKGQTASVGSLSQESSGTNVVAALQAVQAIAQAAGK